MQLSRHTICKRCFFFSSRRRHTRYIGDWSSDVCSSDLAPHSQRRRAARHRFHRRHARRPTGLRSQAVAQHGRPGTRSEERRVGKSVDLGGGRIIKKKKKRKVRIKKKNES